MFFKAVFKDSPFIVQILIVIAVFLMATTVISVISSILVLIKIGMPTGGVEQIQQSMMNNPELLRETQFFQTIGMFIFPSIVCAWLFSDHYKDYLQIDHPVYLPVAVWTVISVIVAIPFLNFTHYLNLQIVLPESLKGMEEWIKAKEELATDITEKMLYTKNVGTMIFNMVVVCVLAGVGEEFLFRGLLQKVFGKIFQNPHTVIWVVAIIFSAIHLQFYGFLTRMLLGAYLGYLLYYTKTIWIPVLAHFTNNLIGVGTFYIYQDSPQEMQEIDALGYGSTAWLSIVSLALFIFCLLNLRKKSRYQAENILTE
jgi:membrane protease YdiL (CAAX protease family)